MLIVLGFPRYIQLFWLQGPDSNKFCFDQSAMGSSSSKQNPTEEIMRLVVLCLFQNVLLTFVLFKINCYPCNLKSVSMGAQAKFLSVVCLLNIAEGPSNNLSGAREILDPPAAPSTGAEQPPLDGSGLLGWGFGCIQGWAAFLLALEEKSIWGIAHGASSPLIGGRVAAWILFAFLGFTLCFLGVQWKVVASHMFQGYFSHPKLWPVTSARIWMTSSCGEGSRMWRTWSGELGIRKPRYLGFDSWTFCYFLEGVSFVQETPADGN